MILEEKQQCLQYMSLVWDALMDESIPLPSDRQFLLWLTLFDRETVERGISVAAAKVMTVSQKGRQMASDEVLRYASGVMRNVKLKQEGRI